MDDKDYHEKIKAMHGGNLEQVIITRGNYEAMQRAIAEKVDLQFTADELSFIMSILDSLHYPRENGQQLLLTIKEKLFRMHREARRQEGP